MINIALCDDNELFLKELSSQIDLIFPDAHSISLFTSAKDLINRIEFFSEDSIDIVITDIEMPEINGIDMAKELCMVENNEIGRKIRKYFINFV